MASTEPLTTAGYSIVVVDDDSQLRTRLAMQLGQTGPAASYPTLQALEDQHGPDEPLVVILGPSFGEELGLAKLERFARSRPETGIILVVEALSTDLLQRALRLGVRDVMAAPCQTSQLLDSVDRVGQAMNAASGRNGGTPAAEVPAEQARVITVFSTKGGAGKSVIAANLAVILARRSDRPVVLVDADLQFGDVAVMLKLTPEHTIVDAVASMDRLDSQLLRSLLVKHEPSGLLVLPAPLEPAFADQVSASDTAKIITILKTFCSYVIIDTASHFNDVVLSLLEQSDDILMVAGMDIPSIKNVKLGLQTLRLLNMPISKLKLVLNRANSKVKLDVGEVERALGVKADSLIPSDIVVPQSVNKGVPAVIDAPKSGVTRSFEQLTDLFTQELAQRGRR